MSLGRVRRPSIGSLEELEMERSFPKLIKDDRLSVYEKTLMKLKEGSRRCESLHPGDAATSSDVSCVTESDSSETTATASCFSSSTEQPMSLSSSSEQRNKTPSVLYLFSKYKCSKKDSNSTEEESMLMEETVC